MMKLGGKRNINPLIVKFGVAFVFSLAGFFISRLRRKRNKPALPPSSPSFSGHGNEAELGGRAQGKDDIRALKSLPSSYGVVSVSAQKYEDSYPRMVIDDNAIVGLSPSNRRGGDNNDYLLPEFNELVKELDFGGSNFESDVKTPRAFRSSENGDYEQEVRSLKNMVRMLREREKNLEIQLLEYYGLKEQEKAVMELQNRLKINNMEAKLLNLKIESLQSDNHRLEAQATEHAKLVAELEASRSKIKLLKKKLRSEAEHNREQILSLQKRVTLLQEQDRNGAKSDSDTLLKLQKLKVFEDEAEELRKSNMELQIENSELAQKLESTQMLAISVLDDPETEALKEMSHRLREENETLSKEVEQLKAEKCAGVEELVYLKWINACLRFELRNYQPPPGKVVARDLSKTLSPKSEEKAKHLILEYANIEGVGSIMDIDSDQWSTSQASSSFTDSENLDESLADKSTTKTSSKKKFFQKLRKLIRGKDVNPHNQVSSGDKTGSFEDGDSPQYSSGISIETTTFSDMQSNGVINSSASSSRHSLDIQKLRSMKENNLKGEEKIGMNSDPGSSYRYDRYTPSRESTSDMENHLDQDANLMKFAEVLMDSHGRRRGRLPRKSASFSLG